VIVEARALKTMRTIGPSAMLSAIRMKTGPPTMAIRTPWFGPLLPRGGRSG
jgi:hypothetical protein